MPSNFEFQPLRYTFRINVIAFKDMFVCNYEWKTGPC